MCKINLENVRSGFKEMKQTKCVRPSVIILMDGLIILIILC